MSQDQPPGPSRLIGIRLLLLACVVIWGWTFVASKICLSSMSPFELIGLRFGIGLPLLLVIVLLKRIRIRFTYADTAPLLGGSAIIAVHFIIQAIALSYTSATNTGWIIAVTPLALAALSYLFLRERIGRWEISGIGVATAGIILLIYNGNIGHLGGLQSIGDWLILASAHTWALYSIISRTISRRHHPLVLTLVFFTPVTLICLGIMSLSSHTANLLSLPPQAVVALLFLAVPGTATQWFWQESVSRLGATRAGIFLYLEPIATTVLAVPLLGEQVTIYIAAGGLMVLGGVWWAQREKRSG